MLSRLRGDRDLVWQSVLPGHSGCRDSRKYCSKYQAVVHHVDDILYVSRYWDVRAELSSLGGR